MIIGDRAVGILTSLIPGSDEVAVYTDIYKQRRDIEKYMNRIRKRTPMKVPRHYVRFDWQSHNIP